MDFPERSGHSPNIIIYLEIGTRKVRLSDVLYNSATLFENAEVPPHTKAALVFSIDGVEEREDVILDQGISGNESLINFSYSDPERLNGVSVLSPPPSQTLKD